MKTVTPNQRSAVRATDRLVRLSALALAGFTLVWLSGCGEPVDVQAVQKAKQQAAVAEQEAKQAVLNEGPTPIVAEDFWRVEKKEDVNAVRGATSQAFLRSKNKIEYEFQLEYNLKIHGEAQGYPKSHEEFMKLVVDEWGMPIPRLKEPYEIWYNAETHEIMKRPKQPATEEPATAPSETESQ